MSKASRVKGHSFERLIANRFKELYPDARRQLEYHADDAKGIDIQNTGALKIQCKKFKQYVSVNTIREIQCDRALGDIPILVTAGDNQEAMAVLPLEDLLFILKHSTIK